MRIATWTLVGIIGIACISSAEEDLGKVWPAVPDENWDKPFRRTEGWTGADAMYSVDLLNGKVLWLFADTWIGPIKDGRHAEGSRLVNNTIAMHSIVAGGKAPEPDAVQFRWGRDDAEDHPTAWIKPTEPDNWYWVADGILTKGTEGNPRLAIFLWKMRRAKGDSVFGFALAGGSMAVISNPHDDWKEWKVEQHSIPHTVPDPADGEKQDKDSSEAKRRSINWGSEILSIAEEGKDWLHIYGYRSGKFGNEMLLARVPTEKLTQFDAWEFRTKDEWSKSIADAYVLADGMPTEFSVTPIEVAGKKAWLIVQSEIMFGPRVMARLSSSPYGPWTKPSPIFEVPDLKRNKKYFSYAAKAHPELSAKGEMLITYVVNSFDFGAMIHDPEIYRPRFIRLNLDALKSVDVNR